MLADPLIHKPSDPIWDHRDTAGQVDGGVGLVDARLPILDVLLVDPMFRILDCIAAFSLNCVPVHVFRAIGALGEDGLHVHPLSFQGDEDLGHIAIQKIDPFFDSLSTAGFHPKS